VKNDLAIYFHAFQKQFDVRCNFSKFHFEFSLTLDFANKIRLDLVFPKEITDRV